MSEAVERAVTALRLESARPIRPEWTEADLPPLDEMAPGIGLMYRRHVRAVLAAIREPDEAMLFRANRATGGDVLVGESREVWRAMIDEMLRDV